MGFNFKINFYNIENIKNGVLDEIFIQTGRTGIDYHMENE